MLKTTRRIRLLVGAVGVVLSFFLVRNIVNLMAAQDRITQSREKIREEERQRDRLQGIKEHVTSDQFIEQQARDKLGLARPGETVVVLPDEQTLKNLILLPKQEGETKPAPPWKQWFDLFFGGLRM